MEVNTTHEVDDGLGGGEIAWNEPCCCCCLVGWFVCFSSSMDRCTAKKKTSIIWMLAGEEFFGFRLIGCSHVSNLTKN